MDGLVSYCRQLEALANVELLGAFARSEIPFMAGRPALTLGRSRG